METSLPIIFDLAPEPTSMSKILEYLEICEIRWLDLDNNIVWRGSLSSQVQDQSTTQAFMKDV